MGRSVITEGPPLRFETLGPLRVRASDQVLALGPPLQRALLAALLVDGGRAVQVPVLLDRLWEDEPPHTAVKSIQKYVSNLRRAARRFAGHGLTGLIEPINWRDVPGFLLNTQADAHAVIEEVGEPNVRVQMDLYHCQIVEGDLAMKIRRYLPGVGHVQIAGVPERHEPDIGEVNYPYLFKVIDDVSAQCGWDGWIGCEYRPSHGAVKGGTTAGLGWRPR